MVHIKTDVQNWFVVKIYQNTVFNNNAAHVALRIKITRGIEPLQVI
jgi:hypothetical protein